MNSHGKWPNWVRWLAIIPVLFLGLLLGGFLGIFTYWDARRKTFFLDDGDILWNLAIPLTAVLTSIIFSCLIAPKHRKALSIILTILISTWELVSYLNHFTSIYTLLGTLGGGFLAIIWIFTFERDKLNSEKIEDWKEEIKDDIYRENKISLCKNYTFSGSSCPPNSTFIGEIGMTLSACGLVFSFILSGFIYGFLNNCLNDKLNGNLIVYLVVEIILIAFFIHLLNIFKVLKIENCNFTQYFKDEKGNYYEICFCSFVSKREDSSEHALKRMEDIDKAHNLEEAFNAVDRYKKGIKEWNFFLEGDVVVTKLEDFKLIRRGKYWSVYSYMKNGRKIKKRISNGFRGLADALQGETAILN